MFMPVSQRVLNRSVVKSDIPAPTMRKGGVRGTDRPQRHSTPCVVLFFETFPSITEPYLLSVVKRLSREGMVRAVFSHKPAGVPKGRSVELPDELESRIHYLPWRPLSHIFKSRFFCDVLRGCFSNPSGFLALARAARRERNSIKGAIRSFATILPMVPFLRGILHIETSWLAQRFKELFHIPGLKIVVSFRGHDIAVRPEYDAEWVHYLQTVVFPGASRLHFVSHFLLRTAETLDVPREKCVVPSQSIDEMFFDVAWEPLDGVPLLVCVGRLVWIKGFEYAVEAAAILKSRNVPFRLEIIGEGTLMPFLKLLVRHRSIEADVKLSGAVPSDEVRAKLTEAAVFICPSVSPSESLGRQLMEAQAVGVPIVATDVGGIPECVEDGVTALCVPPFEPGMIADKVEYVLAHPDLARRMSLAGRERARKRFRVGNEITAWKQIYAELLE